MSTILSQDFVSIVSTAMWELGLANSYENSIAGARIMICPRIFVEPK